MQEGQRQAAAVQAAEQAARANAAAARAAFRAERLSAHASVRASAEALDKHVRSVHDAAQKRRHMLEANDLRVERTLADKAAARKQLARDVAALDTRAAIDAFEEALTRQSGAAEAEGSGQALGKETRIKAYMTEQQRMKQDTQACTHSCAATMPQPSRLQFMRAGDSANDGCAGSFSPCRPQGACCDARHCCISARKHCHSDCSS